MDMYSCRQKSDFLSIIILVVGLLCSGCQQKAPKETQTAVFRLCDIFRPEDLTGAVVLDDAHWTQVAWNASEMALWTPPPKPETGSPPQPTTDPVPALGYRALQDLGGLKIEQGKLVADFSGSAPKKTNRSNSRWPSPLGRTRRRPRPP